MYMKKSFVIVLLGLPGTGKGTQGHLLAKQLKAEYLVNGDYIREFYKEGPLDSQHKELITAYDKGELVKDEIVVSLFNKMVAKHAKSFKNGVIFDAYPMSLGQAASLEEVIAKYKLAEPVVFFLNASEQEVIRRLSGGRLVCVGCKKKYGAPDDGDVVKFCHRCAGSLQHRSDDKPEIVSNRYHQYKGHIKPVLKHFKALGQLIEINAEQPIESVYAEIIYNLKSKKVIKWLL